VLPEDDLAFIVQVEQGLSDVLICPWWSNNTNKIGKLHDLAHWWAVFVSKCWELCSTTRHKVQ
jgi:hypothetical protein